MNAADLVFVDTNVLIYSADPDEAKYERARGWLRELWRSGRGRLSWQVLHEFYVVATRKPGVPAGAARQYVSKLHAWDPVPPSFAQVERAWHWADAAGLSYWDGLIVAAAEASGCSWLLTEDLQEGREFGAVRVLSPFSVEPAVLLPE